MHEGSYSTTSLVSNINAHGRKGAQGLRGQPIRISSSSPPRAQTDASKVKVGTRASKFKRGTFDSQYPRLRPHLPFIDSPSCRPSYHYEDFIHQSVFPARRYDAYTHLNAEHSKALPGPLLRRKALRNHPIWIREWGLPAKTFLMSCPPLLKSVQLQNYSLLFNHRRSCRVLLLSAVTRPFHLSTLLLGIPKIICRPHPLHLPSYRLRPLPSVLQDTDLLCTGRCPHSPNEPHWQH